MDLRYTNSGQKFYVTVTNRSLQAVIKWFLCHLCVFFLKKVYNNKVFALGFLNILA